MRLPAADSRSPACAASAARIVCSRSSISEPDSTLWCGLPRDEHQVARRAAGDAHVRLARFAGTVDVATDDRHVERLAHVLEATLELVHRRDHVEVLPRAARAGHEVDALGAQAHAFQHVPADLHFLDRIGRERDADGVADAVHQQQAETHGGLHRARAQAAGLGDAQMQRLLDLRGELAVGLDRHVDVRGLQADLEVLEIVPVQDVDVAQRRLDHRVGAGLGVLALQFLLQRTGVHADADRDAVVARGLDHGAHAILAPDVARVDAQAVHAGLGHGERDLVVEVDVRDQRHADLRADLREGGRGIHARHRDAHDVGARGGQLVDLPDRRRDVAGLGVGHALHRDRRVAPDRDRTDHDAARAPAHDG